MNGRNIERTVVLSRFMNPVCIALSDMHENVSCSARESGRYAIGTRLQDNRGKNDRCTILANTAESICARQRTARGSAEGAISLLLSARIWRESVLRG